MNCELPKESRPKELMRQDTQVKEVLAVETDEESKKYTAFHFGDT